MENEEIENIIKDQLKILRKGIEDMVFDDNDTRNITRVALLECLTDKIVEEFTKDLETEDYEMYERIKEALDIDLDVKTYVEDGNK